MITSTSLLPNCLVKDKTESEALISANKSSRDKSRSPMQWNNSKYYGFSSVEPWINIEDKLDDTNVE
ncbi:alpha-amylase family glycosyl hydrolase, partial [Clostridium perfringens]